MNKFLLVGDFQYRLKVYQQAIKKTLARGKQIIILVPDLETIPFFAHRFESSISIIHSGLTRTIRYLEWQKIRNGAAKIIIGSNSALFTPVRNLGLIIIDQEENETYKNGQSPRFHAVDAARQLAEISSANIILGSLCPRTESHFDASKGSYKLLRSKPQQKNIVTVNMNFEKGIISHPLQEKINESLEQKKKIILVLNRKGEGTKFSCTDCGWIATCEKCGLPLVPQKEIAVCYNCEKNFSTPENCSKCGGIHLKPFGIGTKKLKKFAEDLWPKTKVIIIEKNGINNNHVFDIAIVTSYALKFPYKNIGLVGIIDADQSLNFPDFRSPERTFQTLNKFLRIGEEGIIQTHLPENYAISALNKLSYDKFFLEDLENRKKSQFPPFSKITRLLYKNASEEICRKESDRVFKLLTADNQLPITFLGPSPCFIKKERGKFRYQIVIKSKLPLKSLPSSLASFLRLLPKGWIVDVDPIDLL